MGFDPERMREHLRRRFLNQKAETLATVRKEVVSGKTSSLHALYFEAKTAQRRLDDDNSLIPEKDQLRAALLPEIFQLAIECGVDIEEELCQVRAQLEKEAEAGDRVALYELSEALRSWKYDYEMDLEKADEHLIAAARLGHVPAIRTLDARCEGERDLVEEDSDFLLKLPLVSYWDLAEELAKEFGVDLNACSDQDFDQEPWTYIPSGL